MGLDVSLFGYSVQDYALRSIRSLFFPLICILLVGLLCLAADSWLRGQIAFGKRAAMVARVAIVATVSGVVIVAVCWVVAVVRPADAVLVVPYLMAGGVLIPGNVQFR